MAGNNRRPSGPINLAEYVARYHQDRLFYSNGWTEERELRMLGLLRQLQDEGLVLTRQGNEQNIVRRIQETLNTAFELEWGYGLWHRKLFILAMRFKRFTHVLRYSGVNWNSETNSCQAPDGVWEDIIRLGYPYLLTYYSKGERHFALMQQVFGPLNG